MASTPFLLEKYEEIYGKILEKYGNIWKNTLSNLLKRNIVTLNPKGKQNAL
jgi:hypothetical protein